MTKPARYRPEIAEADDRTNFAPGPGNARYSLFLKPVLAPGRIALPMVERGYAYTGVDVSEAMMNQLRQKVAGKPHRLTLLKADATALPLEANQFDVAIAAHILHLIPAWQQALGEIHRVLKPDGVPDLLSPFHQ